MFLVSNRVCVPVAEWQSYPSEKFDRGLLVSSPEIAGSIPAGHPVCANLPKTRITMENNCVHSAWNAYAQSLGCKTGITDLGRFWYYRYCLCGVWPGQPTPISAVLDVMALLGRPHRLMIDRIEMEVYGPDDFNQQGSIVHFRDEVVAGVSMVHGMFYSLNTRHAYFGHRLPDDWICLAIQLRRY